MGERWKFWDEYLDGGMDAKVAGYGLYRAPFYQMGVVHTDDNGNIVEAIGAEAGDSIHPDLTPFEIPASIWAVFSVKGTLNQDVHPLEKLTSKIFTEWLPSSGYEKSMEYEIQIYGPGNTQSDDYVSEIWIQFEKNSEVYL
ncbi:MAG: GyrI-like domain-containing protein [Bacillota bacterium]